MSGKSWILPQSASEYNMGAGVGASSGGPGGRWGTGSVPASASLYSMASGSSSISGDLFCHLLPPFNHQVNETISRTIFIIKNKIGINKMKEKKLDLLLNVLN